MDVASINSMILNAYRSAERSRNTGAVSGAGFAEKLSRADCAGAGNALWGRTAAAVDYSLVNYVSGHKNCSLDEFTKFYEDGLQAKGLRKTDYAALVRGMTGFSDVFSDYKVITKVGSCNVSAANWQRNDFPFHKFFQEGTSADALNDWKPSGPEPRMDSAEVQRNLSSIGAGKMSIIIPEKLQQKMDADPAYAEEIYAKVAKWKADYDRWDNATAASLGMDVAEHQFSKSYCLNLDEDGNVKNFVVTSSGGITGPTEEEQRQFEAEQAAKKKRKLEYIRMIKESSEKRAEITEKNMQYQLWKSMERSTEYALWNGTDSRLLLPKSGKSGKKNSRAEEGSGL